MATILIRNVDDDIHAYLLWKEDDETQHIYCGKAQDVLRVFRPNLNAAQPGVDVSQSDLTDLIDGVVAGMYCKEFLSELNFPRYTPQDQDITGAHSVETITERPQLSLSELLVAEAAPITQDDLPDDLSELDSPVPESIPLAPQGKPETVREREYSRRSARTRGHDSYKDTVKEIYDYQCAVCGVRVESPGKERGEEYEVEAAHIHRAADDGPDKLPNRIALCKFHHWAFDVGWISLSDDYTILVKDTPNYDGYEEIEHLQGKQIHLPEDPEKRPHPHFLEIHRSEHGF